MKRLFKRVIPLFLLIPMILQLTSCGEELSKEELNIYVWTEYVPESVISDFEEKTGIKVNVSTFSSNEDMLAKLKSESVGAFDIIQPSDYMVEQMASQDMLEEIDHSLLTNLANIGEEYLNPDYDENCKYSIPYQGGVKAIAVNTSKITDEIDSYDDLFNPKFENALVVLDDYRSVIGITSKSLGYSENETDPAILSEVEKKLLTLKNNIKLYDSDSPKSALISGDCTLAFSWNAEIALAMESVPDIEIVYPKEGASLFMDNWCIPKGAKNYDNAMKFINYMLEVETAKVVMEEYPYLNPNSKAVSEMGEEYLSNKAKNVPKEVIENGEYIKNLSTDVIVIYDNMWTKLKK